MISLMFLMALINSQPSAVEFREGGRTFAAARRMPPTKGACPFFENHDIELEIRSFRSLPYIPENRNDRSFRLPIIA